MGNATAIAAGTLIQIGKETTRGTDVAANRRLIGKMRLREMEAMWDGADLDFGHLARVGRAPVRTQLGTEWEYKAPLTFEEILVALMSGMKGAVTPTGAGADKTWTFTPAVSSDPLPDTYSLEFSRSDLEASPNVIEQACRYAMVTGFDVAIDATAEEPPQLTIRGVGRETLDEAKTAAIGVPTLNYPVSPLFAVYTYTSFANLLARTSPTQISGQVYGAHWSWEWLTTKMFLDGRQDFSSYGFQAKRKAMLELDVEEGAFLEAEQANKAAGTIRYVELRVIGATLGASNYEISFRGAYYHTAESMQELGGEREGNMSARIQLGSAYDTTGAQDVSVKVVNALTAFP